jgi:hypothetical protein
LDVSVVVGVQSATAAHCVLPNEATADVGRVEADKLTVPVYPPVDVRVTVEVPLLPGDG